MAMPINVNGAAVRTVREWIAFAPSLGARSWQGAMRRFALEHGKAIAMLADDSALFMERDADSLTGTRTTVLASENVQWVGP